MSEVKKGEAAANKVDTYKSLYESNQTFPGIGLFQAVNGDIVLRGRHGQRDVIFPLQKAVAKYDDTVALAQRYARYGVRGWDTLMDIANDFKMRICEAVAQRDKDGVPVPKKALEFRNIIEDTKKSTSVFMGSTKTENKD